MESFYAECSFVKIKRLLPRPKPPTITVIQDGVARTLTWDDNYVWSGNTLSFTGRLEYNMASSSEFNRLAKRMFRENRKR
jgi:hypothetical protein